MNASDFATFSLVMPSTGQHAWDITDGWIVALQRAGMLGQVFRPASKWGNVSVDDDDGLLAFLREDSKDWLILLGLDWHSQPLHFGEIGQLLDRRSKKNISIIWEDYTSDFARSGTLGKEMSAAWLRSWRLASLIISHHYHNINYLKALTPAADVRYLPFGVDINRYHCGKPYSERVEQLHFRGKIHAFGGSKGPYKRRAEIAAAITRKYPGLVMISDEPVSEQAYVQELQDFQAYINLPSFSRSPTLRGFEVLAAGGSLITWDAGSDIPNPFTGLPSVRYYDTETIESVFAAIDDFFSLPLSTRQAEADRSRDLALNSFSLEVRVRQLHEMVSIKGSNQTSAYIDNSSLVIPVVIDTAFFCIAQNGIAKVWESIIDSLVKRIGPSSIKIINRGNSFVNRYDFEEETVPPVDYSVSPNRIQEEIDRVIEKRGWRGHVFASTYYTTSSLLPTVQVIHDLIPELLGGEEPVWVHKRYSIKQASKIICVSFSTRNDLLVEYPDALRKTVVCQNGLVQHFQGITISESDERSILNKFNVKENDYLLYVGGRVGWKGYKNCIVLLRALLTLRGYGHFDVPKLLSISHYPHKEAEISGLLEQVSHELAEASDEELFVLRKNCVAMIYPSICEGFGLPVVEAIASQTPIIASNILPLREAGKDFPIYFDPFSHQQLADVLALTIKNPDKTKYSGPKYESFLTELERRWDFFAQELVSTRNDSMDPDSVRSTFLSSAAVASLREWSYSYRKKYLLSRIEAHYRL